MAKTIFRKICSLTSIIAASVGIFVFTVSAPAHAASGVPTQYEYLNSNKLMIQIAGTNYQAQLASPGCSIPANSMDVLKIWTSMAQAAVLAGKSLQIYTTTCNSSFWITDIVLVK